MGAAGGADVGSASLCSICLAIRPSFTWGNAAVQDLPQAHLTWGIAKLKQTGCVGSYAMRVSLEAWLTPSSPAGSVIRYQRLRSTW